MSHPVPAHDLEQRIAAAHAAYRDCRICPRDCGADRTAAAPPADAFCGLGRGARVYKELVSYGEEVPIGPTWLIDLAGCSLRCPFCTEWAHVTRPQEGPTVALTASWFRRQRQIRQASGAATVSFVGGEPTVNLLAILEALAPAKDAREPARAPWLPVVWNTNGLIAPDALALLRGLVSCFIVDLKLSGEAPGRWLGGGPLDTFAGVTTTLQTISRWPAQAFGPPRADGRPMPRVIVRHLVMPDRLRSDTLPVLDWLAAHAPNATINLMTRYLPMGPAQQGAALPTWMRRICTSAERAEAVKAAQARIPAERLLIDGRAAA